MLKVGIIGYGRIGNEHAAWINGTQSARVAKVFDPTPARRSIASDLGLNVTDQIDVVLNDSTIDAVLVSTPTSMHFDHVMQSLDAGKHVMVEKPMALDLPASLKMNERAKEKNRVLSVFHCRRWDIDYLTVKSLIDSGKLGKVFNIESRLGQWSSCVGPAAKEYRPGWRNEASFGGGGLYDWGSHFVDQLWQLYFPAKPVRVFAQLRGNVWTQDCDDFARVCIDFDNGAVAMCEINTTTTRPLPRWHLDGTEGSADAPFSLKFDTNEWAKLSITKPDGSIQAVDLPPNGLTETQIWEQFTLACKSRVGFIPPAQNEDRWDKSHPTKEIKPAVDVESVLVTMKLLDAARQSSAEGCAVEL